MAYKNGSSLQRALLCLASLGACIAGSAIAQSPTSVLDADQPTLGSQGRGAEFVLLRDSLPPASPIESSQTGIRSSAPPSARLERILLLLKPSAAREQALTTELADLQNPTSAAYHHWLTASDFAKTYGNSEADVKAISEWLQNEGFEVAQLPAGRGWIEFSGTVAQLEQTFHTRIESVAFGGESRFVVAENLSVPWTFAPMVSGLVSLDGTLSTAAVTEPETISVSISKLAAEKSPVNAEAFTPRLVDQLVSSDSLHSSGINGTHETIAIAARSNINLSDVAAFRAAFGLPASPVKIVSADAETGGDGDRAGTTLLASWTGAMAPDAEITVAPQASTAATDGIDLSLAAIVDQNLAHTVVVGHSTCEAALSTTHRAFYAAIYRQAAAQGMSVVAAAGDSGASGCHVAGSAAPVSSGYGVSALASTPWDTAVGVAALAGASSSSNAASLAAWTTPDNALSAYAGGGGSSKVYDAPSWQPLPAGEQHVDTRDGIHNRLLPDLAMPTAIGSSTNPGLAFCLSRESASAGCTLVRAGGSAASAALFAGIAALVQQKYGPQGNMAPRLYALGRHSGVFNDVQQGDARLHCEAGSAGCGADELIGYAAAPGYDLATGLGTVNAHELVAQWATPEALGTGATTVTLSLSPTEPNSTYNPTAAVTLSVTVVSGTGGAMPTGTVTLFNTSIAQNLTTTPLALDATGAASVALEGKFNTGGNEIIAIYSGDSNYGVAESSPPVDVNMQASTTSLTVVPAATSVVPGQSVSVTVTLTVGSPDEGTVPPSGLVTLDMDGLPTTTASLMTAAGVTSATFSLAIPSTSTLATHSLQAVYAGDKNYSASTSPAVTVTVSKTVTTTTVMPATTTPAAGSSLVVNATITSTGTGTAMPSGTVNFLLDNVSQGVGPVTSATTGTTATVTIPTVAAGAHSLVAVYSGDASFATSTSPAVGVTAAKSASVTTITAAPAKLTTTSTETLTATVAPLAVVAGSVYTLTGTVSFYDGASTLLGTVNVISGTATLADVSLAANAAHSLTAVYSGDVDWMTSTSPALLLAAATFPDTIVLASNLASITSGQALILTATVTPNATPGIGVEQNPTGNVIFYNGTTVLGTVALAASPLGDSSVATLTTQTLPGGQDALSAAYVGDTTFNPAVSNVLTLSIEDFTIVASPSNPGTNLNIVQGSAGSAAFVITGLGGYNSNIQVVCAVPSQDDMTCTPSPQDIAPPSTATFVVQTFMPGQQTSTTTVSNHRGSSLWPRAVSGSALAAMLFFVLPFGRRARRFIPESGRRMLMLLLMLVGMAGAGIGCTNGGVAVATTGTPLGVATLKITASANIDNTVVSHSIFLTVNVTSPTATQ